MPKRKFTENKPARRSVRQKVKQNQSYLINPGILTDPLHAELLYQLIVAYGEQIYFSNNQPFSLHHNGENVSVTLTNSLLRWQEQGAQDFRYEILGKALQKGSFMEPYISAGAVKLSENGRCITIPSNRLIKTGPLDKLAQEYAIGKLLPYIDAQPPIVANLETDQKAFIIENYLGEMSLLELLTQHPTTTNSRLRFSMNLLHMMNYIHSFGIIHGDIKLENIIVNPKKDFVFPIDFNLSVLLTDSKGLAERCGSLEYVAPEIIESSGRSEKSDLYSTGKVIALIFNALMANPINKKNLPQEEYIKEACLESVMPHFQFLFRGIDDLSLKHRDIIRKTIRALTTVNKNERCSSLEALGYLAKVYSERKPGTTVNLPKDVPEVPEIAKPAPIQYTMDVSTMRLFPTKPVISTSLNASTMKLFSPRPKVWKSLSGSLPLVKRTK